MKLLVCVKHVPEFEPEEVVRIDEAARGIITGKSTKFRMNRFDEYSVEEALQIKETFPDTRIDIVTVGPEPSAMSVKRAMGMGADHGIHILTETDEYCSPFLVSSRLASLAESRNYDLILAGVMSEDEMQGQVGSMVAEFLSLPCATAVISEKLSPDEGTVYVEREIEGGYRDMLELQLPAVLTIQTGINQPRYPSLSNVMRAKKAKLEEIRADSLGQSDSRQSLLRLAYPQKSRAGEVLEGSQEEKAERLLKILREKSFIE
ncbi:MAG: electron transfer flavoprotein subunit beta/FixA family protein [Proteobacteria bacterium]|nr:electron transfer flavoprotein subunit beta/FixA family protein [Pseudomonadota bacterium]